MKPVLRFGAFAPSIASQLVRQGIRIGPLLRWDVRAAQREADAVSVLSFGGILTGRERLTAIRRIVRKMERALARSVPR